LSTARNRTPRSPMEKSFVNPRNSTPASTPSVI
jgi:hypothetical protein